MSAAGSARVVTDRIHRKSSSEIAFARSVDGVTYIEAKHVQYPHHITRCFHIPGDPPGMASLYLQSVSGGLCEGDEFSLSVTVGADASAHLTTTSATIVHEARKCGDAVQSIRFGTGRGAFVEFLPEPNILMAGSRLVSEVTVQLGEGVKGIIGDAFLIHDPSGLGRRFDRALMRLDVLDQAGTLICRENLYMEGTDDRLFESWPCHAMILLAGFEADGELVRMLRQAANDVAGVYGGVSTLPNKAGLALRAGSRRSSDLRTVMNDAWVIARQWVFGSSPPCRRK